MSNMKNSTAMINVACAIVFLIFVFLYVFCYQADMLTYIQHVWSGGKTHFDPLVGAISFCIVLYLIYYGVKTLFPLPHYLKALSFFPSLLFLGVLTSVTPETDESLSVGNWSWISMILLVGFVIVMKPLRELSSLDIKLKDDSLFSKVAWANYLILGILFLITFAIGNGNRQLHKDLRVENLIDKREYAKASEVGMKSYTSDSTITMLRALALSKQNRLGENLFGYRLTGGSMSLVPHRDNSCKFSFADEGILWRQLGAMPREEIRDVKSFLRSLRRHNVARPAVNDYMLTAYLLDRDLTGFVKELSYQLDTVKIAANIKGKQLDTLQQRKTDVLNAGLKKLPRHYREALILYNHIHTNRLITYTNEVIDADYLDFHAIEQKAYKNPEERRSALQDSYSGTYWFYYFVQ